MLDLLIKNVSVIDGSGRKPYSANVGVKSGKIFSIGRSTPSAHEVIDGNGKTLAPGFIDAHGHSDISIFNDPQCALKLRQGVTTEICGQCGFGHAPVTSDGGAFVVGYYNYLKYNMPDNYSEFTTFKEYLNAVEKLPLGINLGMLLGHGTVRLNVMGLESRKPSEAELIRMKELTSEAMESGALGLSSGLMYAPGSFSDAEELSALCDVVKEHNGVYASHIRNQGKRLVQSVEEAIAAGKNSGTPVIISHHKATGKPNWGNVKESVAFIHNANAQGHEVHHDVYPYLATSTTLNATLPPSLMALGLEKLLEKLQTNEFKESLHQQIFQPTEEWDNDLLETGYDGIMIVEAENTPDAVGKTISEYATIKKLDPFDAYIELLVLNKLAVTDVCFSLCNEDLEFVMKDKLCMIGSDGIYQKGSSMTHPRAVGTFPRVLGRYVRERGLLELPEAIMKMTSLTATTYNLSNKGLIKEGFDADLVLFNPAAIIDQSSFVSPFESNLGIDYVIVNGKIAVDHDRCMDVAAGKVLRGSRI